jgi:DNA-binding NarL/FixJ family response regulator
MTHVLEWSKSGNTLRTQPVEACLSRNRQAYTDNDFADYVPIYIGGREECDSAAQASIETLKTRTKKPTLSPSQWIVLRHLCNGLENAEIAEVMGITVHTVKTHLKMIMARTAMRSRLMLAVTAVKNHWV